MKWPPAIGQALLFSAEGHQYEMCHRNKYAIHAYTHGPVTGSGSCVEKTTLLSTVVELRVPCPSLLLLPYSANVKLTARLSALAVRKTQSYEA